MMHLILSCRAPSALCLRALLAPGHGPALELGDRTVFLDPHDIADRIFVLLVVGVIMLAAPDGLLEHGVREAALDADDHRLVLLVAHHDALEHPLRHLVLLTSPSARRASAGRSSRCARCRAAPGAHAQCSRAARSPAGSAG